MKQKTSAEKLQAIAKKYSEIQHNEDNYSVGGGLDGAKFASNRHEDANNDPGKLTFGKATELFKKASELDIDTVKEILEYGVPNMEWHHAGQLPKKYGGGMKKAYFLNATQIVMVATTWNDLQDKLNLSKNAAKIANENKKNLEQRKLDFLKTHAKRYERVTSEPANNYRTAREMSGKYGWFDSTYKSYNLPEYFSGWAFETGEKLQEFYQLT